MARNNNNFLHKKTLITANSVTVESLDDSTEAYLRDIDSDLVKTVDNFPGANIADGTISPDAIANQTDIISGGGGLTSGGVLALALASSQTFINFDSDNAGQASGERGSQTDPRLEPSQDFSSKVKFYAGGQFVNAFLDSGLGVVSPSNVNRSIDDPTTEAYTFYTRASSGTPLLAKGNIRINLNTPPEGTQQLIKFFGIGAGTDSDQIHSIQILDSANAGDAGAQLYKDEHGNDIYLTLLDSLGFDDISPLYGGGDQFVGATLTQPGTLPEALAPVTPSIIEPPVYTVHVPQDGEHDGLGNTVNLRYSVATAPYPSNAADPGVIYRNDMRYFKGLKGIKLADNPSEFSTDPNDPTLQVRNKSSRIRFKTRKTAGLGVVGAASSTYGQNAPEGTIGETVSNEVWSLVSNKFIYKVTNRLPMQGNFYGYFGGGASPSNLDLTRINYASGVTDGAEVFGSTGFNLTSGRVTSAGAASLISGYLLNSSTNVTNGGLNALKFPFSAEYGFTITSSLTGSNTSGPFAAPTGWPNTMDEGASHGHSSDTHAYVSRQLSTGPSNVGGSVTMVRFPFASEENSTDVSQGGSPALSGYYNTIGSNGDESKGYLWMQERPGTPDPNSVRPVISFTYASSTSTVIHSTDPGDAWGPTIANGNSPTHGYGFGGNTPGARQTKFSFANGTRTTIDISMPVRPPAWFNQAGNSSTTHGYLAGGFDPRPTPQGDPQTTNSIMKYSFASETGAANPQSLKSPGTHFAQHVQY